MNWTVFSRVLLSDVHLGFIHATFVCKKTGTLAFLLLPSPLKCFSSVEISCICDISQCISQTAVESWTKLPYPGISWAASHLKPCGRRQVQLSRIFHEIHDVHTQWCHRRCHFEPETCSGMRNVLDTMMPFWCQFYIQGHEYHPGEWSWQQCVHGARGAKEGLWDIAVQQFRRCTNCDSPAHIHQSLLKTGTSRHAASFLNAGMWKKASTRLHFLLTHWLVSKHNKLCFTAAVSISGIKKKSKHNNKLCFTVTVSQASRKSFLLPLMPWVGGDHQMVTGNCKPPVLVCNVKRWPPGAQSPQVALAGKPRHKHPRTRV